MIDFFYQVLVNPDRPGYIKADYDRGDHLYPNKAGYEAMAAAIGMMLSAKPKRRVSIPKRSTSAWPD